MGIVDAVGGASTGELRGSEEMYIKLCFRVGHASEVWRYVQGVHMGWINGTYTVLFHIF